MIPIQDLLHRIQWDPALRGSVFEIGYADRIAERIVHVPFGTVRFGAGTHAAMTVIDSDGAVRRIPLHRIREVRRDGMIIWQRG